MRRRDGQINVVEYTMCLVVVLAALLAMRIYAKRAFAGRLRQAVDSVGEQYDPRHTTSTWTSTFNSNVTSTSTLQKDVLIGGHTVDVMTSESRLTVPETSGRSGSETLEALGNNLWN